MIEYILCQTKDDPFDFDMGETKMATSTASSPSTTTLTPRRAEPHKKRTS